MNEGYREKVTTNPMMSDFFDMGMSMSALINGVVQTNLRAMQELARVDNPQALVVAQEGHFSPNHLTGLTLQGKAIGCAGVVTEPVWCR